MAEPDGTLVERATLRELEIAVGADVTLQLIEMFLDNGPQRVEALRRAVEARQPAAAAEILHSLKSSALTLGAERLGGLAEQAERQAVSGADGELEALMTPILEASEKTTEYLLDYCERLR